ncbi:sulfatase [Aureococcus anophagefferens]|nr:sulfatase [Aureococcus anophagefferens]
MKMIYFASHGGSPSAVDCTDGRRRHARPGPRRRGAFLAAARRRGGGPVLRGGAGVRRAAARERWPAAAPALVAGGAPAVDSDASPPALATVSVDDRGVAYSEAALERVLAAYGLGGSGFEDHFNHVSEVSFCGMDGAGCWFDLKNGTTPVTNRTGDYGLYILRDVASQKIRSRDPSKPLLLYFASPTVHMPMQTPPLAEDGWWTDKLKAIANIERRAFAAATVATDNVAGDVVDALRETNHWDDTVFVCASDNGAQPQVSGAGSNWPLRGMKGYYFEGGVRTHAFVHSRLLG